MKKLVTIGLVAALVAVLVAAITVTAVGAVRALGVRSAGGLALSSEGPRRGGPGRGDSIVQPQGERGSRGGAQGNGSEESETHIWVTLTGTVVAGSETDTDIEIQTADGQRTKIGLGPGWLATQGFQLREGDQVTVRGYREDDEFKAAEIVRERDGARIVLRDQDGRPAWAGQGRGGGKGRTAPLGGQRGS